ncbi:hypothetical protein Lal_00008942 [Lupinus albus]|nr:hypothetical protein Lal_00008942 [Lupinus albus]
MKSIKTFVAVAALSLVSFGSFAQSVSATASTLDRAEAKIAAQAAEQGASYKITSAKVDNRVVFRTTGVLRRMSSRNNPARVAIVMGSKSDWATMQFAAEIFDILNVPHHVEVVSAHRTPDKLFSFAESAEENGYEVIIAGAGGAAHLPGMIAAKTLVPVLGVPVQSAALSGVDSLYSIVQMPRGIPVGTLAIGKAGAANAALLAAQILATHDKDLHERLAAWRKAQTDEVLDNPDPRGAA